MSDSEFTCKFLWRFFIRYYFACISKANIRIKQTWNVRKKANPGQPYLFDLRKTMCGAIITNLISQNLPTILHLYPTFLYTRNLKKPELRQNREWSGWNYFFYQIWFTFYKQQVNKIKMKNNAIKVGSHLKIRRDKNENYVQNNVAISER